MPSAAGKGKVPHSEACEYDPNTTPASPGMPREKYPKGTSKAKVAHKGHTQRK